MGSERTRHGVGSAQRFDAPGERKDIAPVAVGHEQAAQKPGVASRERAFEAREPVVRHRCQGVGAGLHGSSV
jgi:hypothetical protein